jgi:hypothetical protein
MGCHVSGVLQLDHLPVVFYKRFQRLASDLISIGIEINSEEEVDEAAANLQPAIVTVYKLAKMKSHFAT